MIDMRDGNVQHDGFEYNWSFGGKKWRSRAGRFNTGALVRRRRWARLMVRPAAGIETSADEQPEDSRRKEGSPSSGEALAWDTVWKGDEEDWNRCHAALRSQDGDGRKLELWEEWIDHRPRDRTNAQRKQWTEDSGYLPSEAARDTFFQTREGQRNAGPRSDVIAVVLRQHVSIHAENFSVLQLISVFLTTKGDRNTSHFHLSFIKDTIYAVACDFRACTGVAFR